MCRAAEPWGEDMEEFGPAEGKENLSVSWGTWALNTDPERSHPLHTWWFVKKWAVSSFLSNPGNSVSSSF